MLRRALYVAFGVAVAIGSLLLAPLPGPGWCTFFVGLGMVSSEVLRVARLLDRLEVGLRRLLGGAKGLWGKSDLAGRVLIALTISFGVAASSYGAYQVAAGLLKTPLSPLG